MKGEGMIFPIKKILCPTDLSEPSYQGIEAAKELAVNQSAELIIISVVTPIYPGGTLPGPEGFEAAAYYDRMEEHIKDSLDKLISEKVSRGVASRGIVVYGIAADEIVRCATGEEVDLIVIATHGWTGWRRFIFGSVTEKVVRLSHCPVLTIPEPRNAE
jgi:universal stress protein A